MAPIAIVGMACRFPGASSAEALWQNVLRGAYSIGPLPPDRFHRARYYDPEPGAYGKSYCAIGGVIDAHPFDASPYGLPPKVIESTDVVHLWALEVARAAFEDAGYPLGTIRGANAAVIIGHSRGSMVTSDMALATAVEAMVEPFGDAPELRALGRERLDALKAVVVGEVQSRYPKRTEDAGLGTIASGLPALIANTFNLSGSHMAVDAACASSFAALDIAVQQLAAGRIDLALVGGASYCQELSLVMFAQSRALSPDGSSPFDDRANGFISSDGVGLFVLKRLDDALGDRDRIRAVIRGVGASCDGKGRALWAPRKEGQILAIESAYQAAKIEPSTIGLIEAHATSTPVGDKVEVEAIEACFRPRRAQGRGARSPLPIGSIKGNIGHCRESAGAAGLIKAIQALEQATLPPSGNFQTPSRTIPWSDLDVEVMTASRPWSRAAGPRRAGVNAFGIGGLNYHLIVEEAPPQQRAFAVASSPTGAHEIRRGHAREARPRVSAASAVRAPRRALDIALVGVGGRFPGAKDVEQLWRNLRDGRTALSDVTPDRWSSSLYHQPGERAFHRSYAKKGGFVLGFMPDWRRYQLPPRLVERIDPLQFMLLESALDALLDAKIDLAGIDRKRAGVAVGSVFGSDFANDLALALRAEEIADTAARALSPNPDPELKSQILAAIRARLPPINEDSSGSFSSSTLASRTAKALDLMGPTFAIDSACASSLAALEAACDLLRSGTVDLMLAGGGDRAMRIQRYEGYCQFYGLSKSDQVKPFDQDADGFLPGEAAAMCVLERLEDAERQKHHIYAVIEGIGASGNGQRMNLHRTATQGLEIAMRRAFEEAMIEPSAVAYVECHGTGAPSSDSSEIDAVHRVMRVQERKRPLLLGSVKSTVGHTQGAAGTVGLIKAALILDRREVPPTANFEKESPSYHFGDQIRVNKVTESLSRTEPLVTAVSAMGISGTNYHVLLGSARRKPPRTSAGVTNGAPASSSGSRSRSANGAEPISNGGAPALVLTEGPAAAELVGEEGFAEFLDRVRPSVVRFVERLWSEERGRGGGGRT